MLSLFQKLETGILAPGFCLFGDNAYFNTLYMAMPYAAVSGGSKDAYKFYHLQLQSNPKWMYIRNSIDSSMAFSAMRNTHEREHTKDCCNGALSNKIT